MSGRIGVDDHSEHATRQSLLQLLAKVKRAWVSPISAFRANRRISDDQLSVAGKPARWTSYDRARSERCRLKVEAAEEALNLARAEQGRSYSLAIEIAQMIGKKTKSALSLLGAVGLAATGLALGIGAAVQARKPDWVLVQAAMQAHEVHRVPTASDERDFLFGMLAVGVVLLIAGLGAIQEWRQRTR
jgi:hypothetical protein